MTIEEQQKEYSALLSNMDWFDKYEFFIGVAGEFPEFSKTDRNEENYVHGCQTGAWIKCKKRDDKVFFFADSTSLLVKGMLAVMADVLSGHLPREITKSEWFLWEESGILENLDETRGNGMHSAYLRMKELALDNQ